jgi:hypothetical protein
MSNFFILLLLLVFFLKILIFELLKVTLIMYYALLGHQMDTPSSPLTGTAPYVTLYHTRLCYTVPHYTTLHYTTAHCKIQRMHIKKLIPVLCLFFHLEQKRFLVLTYLSSFQTYNRFYHYQHFTSNIILLFLNP